MNDSGLRHKSVTYTGFFTLGVLLLFSILFWRARTIYIDMAFQTFVFCESHGFAVQNYRFGAVITQLFPLSAIQLQLPLEYILQIYSCSFYICYLIYFVLIVYVFKKHEMGIVLLISLTLLTSCSFYWAQSELPQGLSFLMLFLSVTLWFFDRNQFSVSKVIFILSLLITTIFFHPLLVFPLVASVVYFYLLGKICKRNLGVLLVATVLVLSFKAIVFSVGTYESGKMNSISNLRTLFPNYLSIRSSQYFIEQWLHNYFAFAFLFVSISVYFLWSGQYSKCLWLFISGAGYTFLINVSFPELGEGTYLQNMHLPLSVMVALPLVYDILPLFSNRFQLCFLIMLFAYRLSIIYSSNTLFTNRIEYLQKLLNYTHLHTGKKFLISESRISSASYFDTWGLPYETLLLSSIPSPDSSRTIALESAGTILDSTANSFINPYWNNQIQYLPKQYFKLPSQRYLKIEDNLCHL